MIKGTKKEGEISGYDNEYRGGPPRETTVDNNYLPDPAAEGSEHTTFGTRESRKGDYRQGATFDKTGKFTRRTDVTNHGRGDHPNPHYHDATGPNSADGPAMPIILN